MLNLLPALAHLSHYPGDTQAAEFLGDSSQLTKLTAVTHFANSYVVVYWCWSQVHSCEDV